MMPFPLLQLPGPALDSLLAQLPPSAWRRLRLCSKDIAAAVDAHTPQLKITQRGPFKPLQHRFPRLAHLSLLDENGDAEAGGAAWQPFSVMLAQELLASVTSLCTLDLPPALGMRAISTCPNIMACSLDCVPLPGLSSSRILAHACTSLLALTSLTLLHKMSDDDLQTLSCNKALVALDLRRLECGTTGLASLFSMQLASLSVTIPQCTFPDGALSSLSTLTSLTRLYCHCSRSQWAGLCLPASLACLTMVFGLPLSCQQLPHLTALHALNCTLTDGGATRLSAACPGLASLSVSSLWLTDSCEAEPFDALTKLQTTREHAKVGMSYWAPFPKLLELTLSGTTALASGIDGLVGASTLVALDVACCFVDTRRGVGYLGPPPLFHMDVSDMAVLTELYSLERLRLDATPDHVQGVALHLSNLVSITWACATVVYEDFESLKAAFVSCYAPQQLHTARFEFLDGRHQSEGCYPGVGVLRSIKWPAPALAVKAHKAGQSLACLAFAAVAWLLSAKDLARVEWYQDGDDCTAWNDMYLRAVAARATIRHVTLSTIGDITPGTLQCVTGRGLEVVLADDHY